MTDRQLRQVLLVIVLTLLCIGIVAVWSSSAIMSEATYGDSLRFVRQHILAIGVGGLLGFSCLAMPDGALRAGGRWLFPVSVLLLILVFAFGQDVGGARRWFRLWRWSFQPSELAQVSLVVYLSDLLARHGKHLAEGWRELVPPLMVTGLAAGLVLLQPDLGTAVAMGAVALLLLFVAKARWQHLAGVVAMGAVALVVLIAGEEYRLRRIFAFLDPWQDPRGSGYQILQSYASLASGGLVGLGVGGSLQRLFYLPSAHTDFIFAIVGEELGLVGTTGVIALFALLLACGFRMALSARDTFNKYLICGLTGMIGFEAMVNMAVVTGLIPTKGIPLPLVSYGGTSMVINLLAVALVLRSSRSGQRVDACAVRR